MWTLAFGHHEDRTPTHGYAATRKENVRKRPCSLEFTSLAQERACLVTGSMGILYPSGT
jgi:hypothetical protein